ncbi:hypothetical protein ACHAXA_010977 [Cyclostephanos tholiformis]|uniref:Uncharacterized protein n=1 Tax=Cyclostephanos tholiformis TaxID=382380 RepID=A0ABD3RZW3_9STRA
MVNTFFSSRSGGWSSNACSDTSSVADIAWAPSAEHSLHKIESESSSETPPNPLIHASEPIRKRSSSCDSSSLTNQLFLSSYGSAFLSGIFADIAQASDVEPLISQVVDAYPVSDACDSVSEPFRKKARITASTSLGRQPKSFSAQSGPAEGTFVDASSPTVVSPRTYSSTIKIDLFNDSVRELQEMAFPSLPQIPNAISTSSCTQLVAAMDEVGNHEDEQDGPSYGWFVSTDDEEAEVSEAFLFTCFPDTKPDLAFKAVTLPTGAIQDLEVQKALAADTIDDVLGDLF